MMSAPEEVRNILLERRQEFPRLFTVETFVPLLLWQEKNYISSALANLTNRGVLRRAAKTILNNHYATVYEVIHWDLLPQLTFKKSFGRGVRRNKRVGFKQNREELPYVGKRPRSAKLSLGRKRGLEARINQIEKALRFHFGKDFFNLQEKKDNSND